MRLPRETSRFARVNLNKWRSSFSATLINRKIGTATGEIGE